MARNEEKSYSMLHRYLQSKKDTTRDDRKRPYLSTLCDDVEEAGKWHAQVLRDIRRNVEEIHKAEVDDTKARELNEKINKLLRERKHWERRIVQLGGKDRGKERHSNGGDDVSKDVFKHNGFFYFGAARNLPGVKEMIEWETKGRMTAETDAAEESAAVLYQRVDEAYYGDVGDDDVELQKAEKEAEAELQAQMVQEWEDENGSGADAEWDDSYLQFVGQQPEVSAQAQMQALALERRKAEVLEQLGMAAGVKR